MRKYEPRERTEIKDPFMTLQEIADAMGVSREMVRQLERSALMKCRKVLRNKNMTPEDFFATLKYNKPIKPSEEGENPSNYELMYDKEELND
jgi:transcriptional regulator with XRE-family HTH domain